MGGVIDAQNPPILSHMCPHAHAHTHAEWDRSQSQFGGAGISGRRIRRDYIRRRGGGGVRGVGGAPRGR